MNARSSLLLAVLLVMAAGKAPAQPTLLRHPALNADGSRLAFSFQGDIWTVAGTGGTARRLTIHEGYDAHPRFSPDGRNIAFQSDRYGNDDVYVMGVDGGRPNRLTFHDAADTDPAFTPDGHVLFTTRRTFAQVERLPEIYQANLTGGTPSRLLDALGNRPVVSPDGRFIAFERGSCRIVREGYRGAANRDVWLYDTEKKQYLQLTDFDGQDIYPRWGDSRTIYYLSAANGRYNLHVLRLGDDGQPVGAASAITTFTDEGVRSFDVSADGLWVAFARGTDLYRMAASGGTSQKLTIDVTEDYRFDPVEQKTYTDSATEFAVSPDGESIAFVVRGELFLRRNDKDNKRTVRLTHSPFRDQNVEWLNDSTLVFLSDRSGANDLYLLRSADPEEPDLFKSLRHEVVPVTRTKADEHALVIAPDGAHVAFRQGRGKLVVATLSPEGKLAHEKTLLDGWATPSGVAWSPDSRWLAYALDDLDFNEEIYIHAADGIRDRVNISLHPRGDSDPVWSPDGSKLGFLSTRNNGDADVWFVWLKKADWEKTKQDWEEGEETGAEAKKADADSTGTQPVEIDFDDIYERLAQVTRLPGNEDDFQISKDGETFFFFTNGGGRQGSAGGRDLMKVKWDGSEMKTVLAGVSSPGGLRLGKKGKRLYLRRDQGKLARIDVDSDKQERLAFSAKMRIDHPAERGQIFEEAWRTLDAGFYDPKFHGRDWKALRDKYRPRALAASTDHDFRDMFNEMLGQLDASHMGLYGSDRAETQQDRTGRLGIEVVPAKKGVRITHVVPGTPAARIDSRLNEGDIITSVDGEAVTAAGNFWSMLVDDRDTRVVLGVEDARGAARSVVIRPGGSMRDALYREWVKERKRLTEQYSGGRLGYIHIQGMNWPSFERFERELTAAGQGKDGLVIDVRFNGGGWTTDMLMTVLTVRQHAYTVPRGAADDLAKEHTRFREHYPFGERLPLSAWTRPSIALCNQNSYSNAEIFSHAFKTLGLGTLVGTPTFGAVISTGGRGLIDGSFVRLPFRGWYVKATDENMENGPAVPDIIVHNAPDSKAKGEDPQLRKAVTVLLGQLDEHAQASGE